MGYNKPIGGYSRKVVDGLLWIHSAPFTRFNYISFGARMSVFKPTPEYPGYVVFAAIPYDEAMIESVGGAIGDSAWFSKISHMVIPDTEHTMAVLGYKERLPNVKVIGMEQCNEKIDPIIDFKFTKKDAARNVASAADAIELFGDKLDAKDKNVFDNVSFVYMPEHVNKELVICQKQTRTMITGDLLFNMQSSGRKQPFTDHFQEAYGGKDPTGFLSARLAHDGFLSRRLVASIKSKESNQLALKAITEKWDFDRIVMCHGDVIERNGMQVFKSIFL